jgi:hypothetical protein
MCLRSLESRRNQLKRLHALSKFYRMIQCILLLQLGALMYNAFYFYNGAHWNFYKPKTSFSVQHDLFHHFSFYSFQHGSHLLCRIGREVLPCPEWQLLWTGVDVIITIFCDFSQFSAEKMAFFLNTNVMIIFFQNLDLFRVKKRQFFR